MDEQLFCVSFGKLNFVFKLWQLQNFAKAYLRGAFEPFEGNVYISTQMPKDFIKCS